MLRKGTLPYLARGRDKQPPAQTDNTEKQTGEQTTQGTEGAKPAQGLKPTPTWQSQLSSHHRGPLEFRTLEP